MLQQSSAPGHQRGLAGQALAEYALIGLAVLIVVAGALALLAPVIGGILTQATNAL